MLFHTEGLVVREKSVGESDKTVVILTKDQGRISAFANGAKKYKSRLFSGTLFLTYSRFSIHKGKAGCKITQASAVNTYFNLKNSLETLALASFFADAAGYFAGEGEESGEVLRLLLNTLYMLSEKRADPEKARLVFELRLLAASGYTPRILSCRACGEYEKNMYFSPAEGTLVCENCKKNGERNLAPLTPGMLTALRFIVLSDAKKIFSFELPKEELKMLAKLADDFFAAHCGREFETLKFYREAALQTGPEDGHMMEE